MGNVARRWSTALTAHDPVALRTLYGARVQLNGAQLTRDEAVAAKASAFVKAPDFRQSIGPVTVTVEGDRARATFRKECTAAGQTQSVLEHLVLSRAAAQPGEWQIIEESDEKSEPARGSPPK